MLYECCCTYERFTQSWPEVRNTWRKSLVSWFIRADGTRHHHLRLIKCKLGAAGGTHEVTLSVIIATEEGQSHLELSDLKLSVLYHVCDKRVKAQPLTTISIWEE